MTTKELTCVVCPAGCRLSVTLEDGAITSVTGNTCARGKKYAESEILNPVRTLTSTVTVYAGSGEKIMLPVRTDAPIPKGKLFDAMKVIRKTVVNAKSDISCGDVILANFGREALGIDEDVNLIACKNITA